MIKDCRQVGTKRQTILLYIGLIKKRELKSIHDVLQVVKTNVLVHISDGLAVFFVKGPRKEIEVGLHTAFVATLRDHGHVAFNGPTQENLACGFTVLVGNCLDTIMLEKWTDGAAAGGEVVKRGRTKGRIGGNVDALLLRPFDETRLLQIRV